MSIMAPMTSLEAVNRMLASLGQAPVNTVDLAGVGDAANALRQLQETARDVQTVGYSWNSDYGMDLSPDPTDNSIVVPVNVLDIDASDASQSVVVRENANGVLALYDADNHTFSFTSPVTVDIIWGYEFDSLPQSARSYIATAAARRFQAQTVSSPILDRYSAEDEARAFALLQRYERRSRDTNAFRKSRTLASWTKRRSLSSYTPG